MNKRLKILLTLFIILMGFSSAGYAQNDKGMLTVDKQDTIIRLEYSETAAEGNERHETEYQWYRIQSHRLSFKN